MKSKSFIYLYGINCLNKPRTDCELIDGQMYPSATKRQIQFNKHYPPTAKNKQSRCCNTFTGNQIKVYIPEAPAARRSKKIPGIIVNLDELKIKCKKRASDNY